MSASASQSEAISRSSTDGLDGAAQDQEQPATDGLQVQYIHTFIEVGRQKMQQSTLLQLLSAPCDEGFALLVQALQDGDGGREAKREDARQQLLAMLQELKSIQEVSPEERVINGGLERVARKCFLDALLGPPDVNIAGLADSADQENMHVRAGLDFDTSYVFFNHPTALTQFHFMLPQTARWDCHD